jgi:ATP-dependent DNA helicase RecG
MIATEELEHRLKELQQALQIETQHRFVDIQGKKKKFSVFLNEVLSDIQPLLTPMPEGKLLLTQAEQYAFADLNTRMKLIERLHQAVLLLQTPQTPQRPRTVMKNQIDTAPSEVEVQFCKGVGPRVGAILNKAGVNTIEDLLYYFPRRYLDYNTRLKIAALSIGQEATVIATVQSVSLHQTKARNLWIMTVVVKDETGSMLANWVFAKASRTMMEGFKAKFARGTEILFSGKIKWDAYKNKMAMDRPETEILSYAQGADDADVSLHAGRIVPVYPLVEGLNLKTLRKAIRNALNDFLPGISDPMPAKIIGQENLQSLQGALEQIHFPDSEETYQMARTRLVFDELFYIQLRLALLRANYKQESSGLRLSTSPHGLVSQFLQQLPFQLTGAQARSFQEIQADMASEEPMYRLLQGDVGSGKTMVALLTLLVAVENNYQGVLMAPTEILAEQHYRNFVKWLTPLGLKMALVVGKNGSKARREIAQGLLNGQIHIAVGTQALVQEAIEFARLGCIVVDEQHRFGVRQRLLLKRKGNNPEMLTMTATPIPRTLAMTVHGDLDVSILDELPPGRSPIQTVLSQGKTGAKNTYDMVRLEVMKGRQAYIIFPLIEESETLDIKAAAVEFEALQAGILKDCRMGLLHGKLPSQDKEQVMAAFSTHQIDVLVSTTVVEVGVDVANATVIVIENADRFGLAQLHQLRGRVGRGRHQAYCILRTESKGSETLKRLEILVQSQDGFYIAEQDMALRGPGEFLGTKQSGLPTMLLADLVADKAIFERARQVAFEVVAGGVPPELYDVVYSKTEQTFNVLSAG